MTRQDDEADVHPESLMRGLPPSDSWGAVALGWAVVAAVLAFAALVLAVATKLDLNELKSKLQP